MIYKVYFRFLGKTICRTSNTLKGCFAEIIAYTGSNKIVPLVIMRLEN